MHCWQPRAQVGLWTRLRPYSRIATEAWGSPVRRKPQQRPAGAHQAGGKGAAARGGTMVSVSSLYRYRQLASMPVRAGGVKQRSQLVYTLLCCMRSDCGCSWTLPRPWQVPKG